MTKHLLLTGAGALFLALACQRQVQTGAPRQGTAALDPDEVPDSASSLPLPANDGTLTHRNYYMGFRKTFPVEPRAVGGLDTLLQRTNLTTLLRLGNADGWGSMNGFGNAQHYRYEVVFTSVKADPQQPAIWFVTGKTRYKHVIRSFSGTIAWQGLYALGSPPRKPIMDDWADDSEATPEPVEQYYTVTGCFQLRESNGGQLVGQVNADFSLDATRRVSLPHAKVPQGSPTCGAGMLFEGQRLNAAGQPSRSVVWGSDFIAYASKVTGHMSMGLRGPNISPDYVSRGWNEYYQNEEWWAEAPKANAENALWPSAQPSE